MDKDGKIVLLADTLNQAYGSIAECNNDKMKLRQWTNQMQDLYKEGK